MLLLPLLMTLSGGWAKFQNGDDDKDVDDSGDKDDDDL